MPLKRQRGLTTNIRYRLKMYAVAIGKAVGNEQLAMEYAIALSEARSAGAQSFNVARNIVEAVCSQEGIPRGYWGIYYSFAMVYTARVLRDETWTHDEAINHFARLGANPTVSNRIAEALTRAITAPEVSSPKPKKS